jgi:uncharacterized SAM-dependent methyltransferase
LTDSSSRTSVCAKCAPSPSSDASASPFSALTSAIVTVAGLGLTISFAAGEEMRTEISAKIRSDGLKGELTVAGLELLNLWTDPAGDFALSLSTPK